MQSQTHSLQFQFGPWREMAKATDIKLPALHEYMTYVDCQSDQRDATLAVSSAECLQNTTCVGIRMDQPGAFCTLLNSPRDNGITPIDNNLWLIINEIPGFAGQLYIIYNRIHSKLLQYRMLKDPTNYHRSDKDTRIVLIRTIVVQQHIEE